MNQEFLRLIDLSSEEARLHFLKGSSYFNNDLPEHISFEPILTNVSEVLNDRDYTTFKASNPADLPGVNYNFITNKDGRFAWRPLELMHPAIYVSLVNLICDAKNWQLITTRLKQCENGIVDCCSAPVQSTDHHTDTATQIKSWWQHVEQQSLTYSLEFSHLLHTDVIDCYGSLYSHSIAWALHGFEEAKNNKGDRSLLGNKIDSHIQAGRYGQTNGISQGSVLMDFVAEIVLGYVDELINCELKGQEDIKILRYRDDYRIFSNSDERGEKVLKIISDNLRVVGMKLGISKTVSFKNVVEGSIKSDKLAGIDLQNLGDDNAETMQKQLLRLHSFGQRFPNSGALRRLVSEFHDKVFKQTDIPDDLEVQVAIATDIAFVSPVIFPAMAGILSHLISLAQNHATKVSLWDKVRKKMGRVPYNGYLEIWLQRVTQPKTVGIKFESEERICQIVNGNAPQLWNCDWIACNELKKAMDVKKIVVADVAEAEEVIQPEEVELFRRNAWLY